ncbi:hypothetical protein IKF81_03055 [Candidatus Saccharibacteria bacterium]|nr:hypothetical protein [Candidatus Saccharibacteria bacterium]
MLLLCILKENSRISRGDYDILNETCCLLAERQVRQAGRSLFARGETSSLLDLEDLAEACRCER